MINVRGSDGFQDGHVGYYDMANMMKKITDNGGYLTWRQAFDATVVILGDYFYELFCLYWYVFYGRH